MSPEATGFSPRGGLIRAATVRERPSVE